MWLRIWALHVPAAWWPSIHDIVTSADAQVSFVLCTQQVQRTLTSTSLNTTRKFPLNCCSWDFPLGRAVALGEAFKTIYKYVLQGRVSAVSIRWGAQTYSLLGLGMRDYDLTSQSAHCPLTVSKPPRIVWFIQLLWDPPRNICQRDHSHNSQLSALYCVSCTSGSLTARVGYSIYIYSVYKFCCLPNVAGVTCGQDLPKVNSEDPGMDQAPVLQWRREHPAPMLAKGSLAIVCHSTCTTETLPRPGERQS